MGRSALGSVPAVPSGSARAHTVVGSRGAIGCIASSPAMSPQSRPVRIKNVEPLDGYVLRLRFNDDTTRDVDVGRELWGPVFEELRDPALFRQVSVDHALGTIVWPNDADLDPDVLRG